MNSKNRKLISVLAIIIFCACSPALYMPTFTDVTRSGISVDSLMLGRTLYVNHCGSCHNLHLPEQYTSGHWGQKMPEMQGKAKISGEEAKLILNYVNARCNLN